MEEKSSPKSDRPKIKIIFENQNQVVIDKPAEIMAHPDGRKEEFTLADWLKEYSENKFQKPWREILENLGEVEREGIVHRLDTNTTGVLIMALTRQAYNFLKRQFQAHTLKKTYRAIVIGKVKQDTGIIDAPIARARSDFRKKSVKNLFDNDGQGDVRGRERRAITRYKVLARLENKAGEQFSYLECYPQTGRTHQIRVHLKSIRHPILGDEMYGVKKSSHEKIQAQFQTKIARPMLHAKSLEIKILNDQEQPEERTFVAPIPKDMEQVLRELGYQE